MAGFAKSFVLSVLAYLTAVLIYESAAETLDKSSMSWSWFLQAVSAISVGLGYGVLGRVLDPVLSRSIIARRFLRAEFVVGLIYSGGLLLIAWVFGIGPKTLVVIYGVILVGLGAVSGFGPVETWIELSMMPRLARLARGLYERLPESLFSGFAIFFLASAVADHAEQPNWAEFLSEVSFLMLVSCALIGFVRVLRESWSRNEPGT